MTTIPAGHAAIVLLGGPANYDNGNRWTMGRVVDYLPPHAEPPLEWIYVTWAPWHGGQRAYGYRFAEADAGAVVLTYRGPMPADFDYATQSQTGI